MASELMDALKALAREKTQLEEARSASESELPFWNSSQTNFPSPGFWASISAARPDTSCAEAPFARSATANPATCAGVASPVITSRIAQAVSSAARCSPACSP